MSNQDILNTLSGLEAAFYYRKDGSDSAEGVRADKIEYMHTRINELLHIWHNITGLYLTD